MCACPRCPRQEWIPQRSCGIASGAAKAPLTLGSLRSLGSSRFVFGMRRHRSKVRAPLSESPFDPSVRAQRPPNVVQPNLGLGREVIPARRPGTSCNVKIVTAAPKVSSQKGRHRRSATAYHAETPKATSRLSYVAALPVLSNQRPSLPEPALAVGWGARLDAHANTFVQEFRGEISSVRPDDGVEFGV